MDEDEEDGDDEDGDDEDGDEDGEEGAADMDADAAAPSKDDKGMRNGFVETLGAHNVAHQLVAHVVQSTVAHCNTGKGKAVEEPPEEEDDEEEDGEEEEEVC